MKVTGLRSPYDKVGGMRYFGRMLDKIRLNQAGTLPAEYHANLGIGFDGRATSFLKIEYAELVERVKAGGTDEEVLDWAFKNGRKPSEEEIEIWGEFLRKRGWNDEGSETLQRRLRDAGMLESGISTFFDFIDADEGRQRHHPPE